MPACLLLIQVVMRVCVVYLSILCRRCLLYVHASGVSLVPTCLCVVL